MSATRSGDTISDGMPTSFWRATPAASCASLGAECATKRYPQLSSTGFVAGFETGIDVAVEAVGLVCQKTVRARAPLAADAARLHAGCACADARTVEDDHRAHPALTQMNRDRQARDAGADDRDLDLCHASSASTASSSTSTSTPSGMNPATKNVVLAGSRPSNSSLCTRIAPARIGVRGEQDPRADHVVRRAADRRQPGQRPLEAFTGLTVGVALVQRAPVGAGRRRAADRHDRPAADGPRVGGGALRAAAVTVPLHHFGAAGARAYDVL